MQPTPSKFKKFLIPGLIIVALVVIGLLLFLKDRAVDQGAALFTGVTKTSSLRAVPPVASSCRSTVGANGVPVAPAPSITVISPNGGENYHAGDQVLVKWTTCNIPATATMIIGLNGFEPGNIGGYSIINTPNDGSEMITLPLSTQFGSVPGQWHYGTWYKINVSLQNNVNTGTLYRDLSDNLFSINGPGSCIGVINPIEVTVDTSAPTISQYYSGTQGDDMGHFKIKANCNVSITELSSGQSWQGNDYSLPGNPPATTYKYYDGTILLGIGTNSSIPITNPNGFFQLTTGQSKIITLKLDLTQQSIDKTLRVSLGVIANNSGISVSSIPAKWFKIIAQCPPAVVGNFSMTMNNQSPASATIAKGTPGVTFAVINLKNTGTTTFCYNGVQTGSVANTNLFMDNIRIQDGATGAQVGPTLSGLSTNGSYYYGWVQLAPSIPVVPGATQTFYLVGDVPLSASTGSVKLGIFGMNFDAPGASGGTMPISGATMQIQ